MKTFREHIDESFFVITSDNYQSISNSHLYGYCFYNGGLIRDCDIDDSTAIGSDLPGCYIAVKKTENGIHIVQDCASFIQIYYFKKDNHWAVSNSFWKLAEVVKKKYPLTLDETFCEQFFSTGVSPLTVSRTLSNEIKIAPACMDIILGKEILFRSPNVDLINKIPIDTQEAMKMMDRWISRWASIIRSIFDAGYPIKFDLSGGFDSRISFALAVVSGIDLNSDQITVYSRPPSKTFGDEDWNIASSIAEKFHFKLSPSYDAPNGVHINGFDNYEIFRNILSNTHREPYFPGSYYEKPIFYINGLAGESVRGWKNRDDFFSFFSNPYGKSTVKYPATIAQTELEKDWENLPVFSKDPVLNELERNRFYCMIVRMRNHMGTVTFQNYILNYIQVTNFNDPDILKIGLTNGLDTFSVFAVILRRACPDLLNFPIQGNREFSEKGLKLANELYNRFPPEIIVKENAFDVTLYAKREAFDFSATQKISPEKILDDKFDNTESANLFKARFGSYGCILYEDALQNRQNKALAFCRQYESAIVAVMEMLKIEQSRSRFFGNNRNKNDLYMMKQLTEKIPKNEFLKKQYNSMIKNEQTLRIDFYSDGASFEVSEISDPSAVVQTPEWMNKDGKKGMLLQSCAGDMTFSIEPRGGITCSIRGQDFRNLEKKRVPKWVLLKNLSVDGKEMLQNAAKIWYERPYLLNLAPQDGPYKIRVIWEPYYEEDD